MTESQSSHRSRGAEAAKYATSLVILFGIVTMFVPALTLIAVALLALITVWHVVMMARTAGSIVPFAVLTGVDVLLIVVLLGMRFAT